MTIRADGIEHIAAKAVAAEIGPTILVTFSTAGWIATACAEGVTDHRTGTEGADLENAMLELSYGLAVVHEVLCQGDRHTVTTNPHRTARATRERYEETR